MNIRGFSLIELVIAISIMAILFSIGMLNFNTYQKKAQIERQTRELYSMIMTVRLSAIQRKQRSALLLGPNQCVFKSYSSPYQNIFTGGDQVSSSSYSYEVKKKTGATTLSDLNITADYIDFDTRGFTSNSMTTLDDLTLVVTPVIYSGASDCIVVQAARTNIGRMENDSICHIR
jgi:prepilin-type N-terminal cleavage/methylation domain-containing protein